MEKSIKTVITTVMAFIIMSSLTACSSTEEETSTITAQLTASNIKDSTTAVNVEMPQPFEHEIDDDGSDVFYLPFNYIINGIPTELMKLRDTEEVDNWISSFTPIAYAPSDISEYANIYSFITDFSITKDEAEAALNYYFESNVIPYEQFNIIYSGDKELITKTFATKYSIVIGENVYCPNWIYTHSIDDYSETGITADMIDIMSSVYSDFTFTEEARNALEEKLSLYSNKPISIKSKESN